MRKLLALVVALSFIAGPLAATQTRINSLGIQNWMIEEDDNLLWMNPARTSDYSKQVWVEANDTAPAAVAPVVANWGGVTGKSPIQSGATIGLFVNRPYWGMIQNAIPSPTPNPGYPTPELAGVTRIPDPITLGGAVYPLPAIYPAGGGNSEMLVLAPQTRFELVYVLPEMGKMTIGARLSSAGDTNNQSAQTTSSPAPVIGVDGKVSDERMVQDTNIAVGAKLKDLGPFETTDLVLNVDMPSAKDTMQIDTYRGAVLGTIRKYDWKMDMSPSMNMGITARGKLELKGNPLLVFLNYSNADYTNDLTIKTDANNNGVYTDAADTSYKQKRTVTQATVNVGAAYNSQLSKKTLLVVGTALQSQSTIYRAEKTPEVNTQAGNVQEDTKQTTNGMQLGINMGVEHKISKVVVGRLGMNQLIMQSTDATTNQKTYGVSGTGFAQTAEAEGKSLNETLGATTVNYGVGLNVLENLTIDALISQNIEFADGFIISGVVQKYIAQVTATYKF